MRENSRKHADSQKVLVEKDESWGCKQSINVVQREDIKISNLFLCSFIEASLMNKNCVYLRCTM